MNFDEIKELLKPTEYTCDQCEETTGTSFEMATHQKMHRYKRLLSEMEEKKRKEAETKPNDALVDLLANGIGGIRED